MTHRGLTTLFVPGLRDHVAEHWQTHMAASIPGSITVEPLKVNRLSRAARVEALDRTLSGIEGDVVLVAHSAGVLMVAFWNLIGTRPIRGALLVTPADVERPLPDGYPAEAELVAGGWVPFPRAPLAFPAIVVASGDDPLARFDRTAELARCWGADLHYAGKVGHLNPAAGFGPWPEAMELWKRLLEETR